MKFSVKKKKYIISKTEKEKEEVLTLFRMGDGGGGGGLCQKPHPLPSFPV